MKFYCQKSLVHIRVKQTQIALSAGNLCLHRTQGDSIEAKQSAANLRLKYPSPFLIVSLIIFLFRITNCRINSGEHELYAIHSFGDEVCFDNSRTGFYNLRIYFLCYFFKIPEKTQCSSDGVR